MTVGISPKVLHLKGTGCDTSSLLDVFNKRLLMATTITEHLPGARLTHVLTAFSKQTEKEDEFPFDCEDLESCLGP